MLFFLPPFLRTSFAPVLVMGGQTRRILPRLRSFGNAGTKAASPGPGPHPAGGVGKAGDDPDAGCLPAHHRRPLADHATLHPAGTRSSADAAPTQSLLAFTTVTSHQGPGRPGTDGATDTENVVPTFGNPSLKTNHLQLVYSLSCESSANSRRSAGLSPARADLKVGVTFKSGPYPGTRRCSQALTCMNS